MLELAWLEGLRAFVTGKPRGANPYSYEASNEWDRGWLTASAIIAICNVKKPA